ncbi:hypothetical protein QBC46DRAFT_370386 [Diplogelasinospora grovesii]|uniref:Uncharacterized protein n=1 Tax=Diplogelasinospora grovesii TaxID=303347 RepID=A0AAN6NIV6_9PEZI|nr:hypothetical protein QBC46DRAFT_370386 [Diplogelasinospora grovesii]
MHQPLYVLVYPSRLFAAHWSFWIPYLDASGQESDTGDRIHVTGDRLNGFKYEYVRDYNVREDERKPNSFAIGLLSTASVSEETERDHYTIDVAAGENDAFNPFDRACREVQAPGPSLNKVNMTTDAGKATGPPLRKTEVKDCQWWIKQAVAHLVEADMLLPLDSKGHGARAPVERVEELPRH